MDTTFKIFVDQLRNGSTFTIQEDVPADFLDVQEKDLSFKENVKINGEAFVAGDELVIHCTIDTVATIPCSICNQPVHYNVKANECYFAEPLTNIKSAVFDFKEVIREAVLIETPMFAECNNGNCREREFVKQYMKKDDPLRSNKNNEEYYQPFADLE